MLSKVLSGRDTARAQPLVFSSTQRRTIEPDRDPAGDGATDAGMRALRERIHHLEADLVAAKRDSFEAGRQQGEQHARTELAPVLERMNASVAELVGMRQDVRRHAEKDVVRLALLIAKRVLHRELSVDANALGALARVVFERLARTESYRVTVHPNFAPAVSASLRGSQTSRVQIDPDPGCAPGTLVIRSDEGVIDASVEAQLEEISRGLTDRLANS